LYAHDLLLCRRESSLRCPVPPQASQITGVQVCAVPLQVHPRAGTRPPPLHLGHLLCGDSACSWSLVLVLVGPRRGAGPIAGLPSWWAHDRGPVAQDAGREVLGCGPFALVEPRGHRVLPGRAGGLPPGGLHPI